MIRRAEVQLGNSAVGSSPSPARCLTRLHLAVLAAFVVLFAIMSSASAETRIALVVGNGSYAIGKLDNPRNDAEAITKSLKAVGFQVTKLLDGDQAALRRAVLEFGRRLKGQDVVGVFYYAGHGVQVAGENYLVPIGADIKDESEIAVQSMNLGEVLRTMGNTQGRTNIVILDACRNNPFASGERSGGGGLAPVNAPAGTLIAFATAPGQIALDGDGANSPYSAALAASIPVQGIVLEEVFRRTRRQVLAATGNKQTPWEHSSLTGEFFFRPKLAQPEASGRPADVGLSDSQIEEVRAWEQIRESRDPMVLRRHLDSFPNGLFADVVKVRLQTPGKPATDSPGAVAGWIGNVVFGGGGDLEAEKLLAEGLKLEARAKPEADIEAFRLYRAAAARGLPAAMHQLARAYDRGRGTEKSFVEAAVWYRKAADLGHAPSQASLGTMYEYAEGVPVDLGEALRLYKVAADAGDANGMASLGYLYQQGKGVAKDATAARKWYAKAADGGNSRAMYNLALLQVRGDGGERDFGEAVRLLKLAIEQGHVGAQREIAFLFDEGRGVARDPKAAAEYLLNAFKAGHKDARTDILERPEAWSAATRREIQKRLAASGHFDGRITGYFDQRTKRAAEAYARG